MKILHRILAHLARAIIRRYRPTIVGITGSAGKTSAKEAVYAALASTTAVRATYKSYNNQIGLPLTVVGTLTPGKNPLGWLRVFVRSLRLLTFRVRYPKVLVLEMGADRPGDIAYLTGIAAPDVSIVTSVGTAHIEFFGSVGAIAEEKGSIVRALTPDGTAILCADDERVAAMRALAKGRVVTYGYQETADVRAVRVEHVREPKTLAVRGLRLTAALSGREVTFELPGVLGKGHVLSALAALAAARVLGVPVEKAAEGLARYAPPPGRVRLIPGVKGTVLIDDTYNSSPDAVHEALEALRTIPCPDGCRRFALLGDMLELGGLTESAHASVGKRAVECGVNILVAVGERMRDAAEAARRAGLSEDRVILMKDASTASRFLQDRIRAGDVVLVKGSQGMHMERAVLELMAAPERADELLCRQTKEWK